MFDFLDGISAWYWIGFALALGALELAVLSFFLLWAAGVAFLMAGVIANFPNITTNTQLVVFIGLSLILTVLGRYIFAQNLSDEKPKDDILNRQKARIIGATAVICHATDTQGIVEIDGIKWAVRWDHQTPCAIGDRVKIISIDVFLLHVERIIA